MKKVLITLSGKTKSGKTSTLKKLINVIKEKYDIKEYKYLRDLKDKRVILNNVGKKKLNVGINTAGDDEYYFNESIELFDKYGCDIVICATKASIKTENGTISLVKDFYKQNNNKIRLIPLFKILQEKAEDKDVEKQSTNDDFMINIIIEQLDYLL